MSKAQTRVLYTRAGVRTALRISGEQVYPVQPLSLIDSGQSEWSESVALFAQRAQAVKPYFQLDAATHDAVVQRCKRP
ncbi:MAG: hypothetical protein KJ065_20340 [Anaerolineae bacterium]|nr:hypothetical protein [Anaerolineae bacterium]